MSLTGGLRTARATGIALLAAGLSASGYGVATQATPHSLAGVCLTVTALTLIALTCIRAWIVNTSAERDQLIEARSDAEAERRRYFAAQAALEGEMTRLTRDMAADRARAAAKLLADRTAMEAEFEENRLQLQTEAFRTGVQMERSGMLKPETPALPTNLIPFPGHPSPARERTREHEGVGP